MQDTHPTPPTDETPEPIDPRAPGPLEPLAHYLQRLHHEHGYKIYWIAEKVRITTSAYSQIVNGHKQPRSVKRLEAMAEAYGLPTAWFTRYGPELGRKILTVRQVLTERRLLEQFIGIPVPRKSYKWIAESLTLIAHHLDDIERSRKQR